MVDNAMFQIIANAHNEAIKRNALNIWTVYDHPKDFPHSFVARRAEVGMDGLLITSDIVQGELRIIRNSFRRCGLTCLKRSPQDEPQIVECWL